MNMSVFHIVTTEREDMWLHIKIMIWGGCQISLQNAQKKSSKHVLNMYPIDSDVTDQTWYEGLIEKKTFNITGFIPPCVHSKSTTLPFSLSALCCPAEICLTFSALTLYLHFHEIS